MTGKSITGLTFYSDLASQNWAGTFQVFLKEVSETTLTAFTGTTGATIVFEGTGLANDANKNLKVTFQNNYTYNGGHLLIGFYQTVKGNFKTAKFYGVNQDNVTAWQGYNSSNKFDDIAGSGKYFIPKTTITYETPVTGPGLAVFDGSSKLTTNDTYDFGLATSGTEKTFTLKNPGTESITVNIVATNNFGVSPASATIAAKGETTITVTMANTTATGAVTITPTTNNVDAFVIKVKGTIKDPNKFSENFSGNALPEGWTSGGNRTWTYNNGYAASGGYSQSYYTTLTTPKLTFTAGEQFFFDALMNATYDASVASMIVQTSTDGTTFTDVKTITSTDISRTNWASFSVTIPSADVKYIRFDKCIYVAIDNIYGGELPFEPKMVVTQPASLDYGVITEATAKTFTIANTGKAELKVINVTSSNDAFTITGAPSSLAAGASAEVTIIMAPTTVGNLSSTITVSATGMEDVTFNVNGIVLPTNLSIVDFNDNQLPARWENSTSPAWSFSNGKATAGYGSYGSYATMTTPKIIVNNGDMFVVKAKLDGEYSYYVTVKGLNSSNTEVYSKTLGTDVFNDSEYSFALLTDVPTTVEKLQFVGYKVLIDEIQGVNYAAALSVTQAGSTVSTPESYDFGECAADATVTYNFANAGAGTINITNVAIIGDGADAYSTNWSESVAAPFDLEISRTYNSERTTAQSAAITVTTTEGDFVINVTGTDKAANAPELDVDITSVDFGKITGYATRDITVTNKGTGTMSVNIAVKDDVNGLYTVSPNKLDNIAAGESKTFTITLNFSIGNYGVKTANVVVTPTYDETAAMTIACTGKVMDPDLWSEDFSENELPIGWTIDGSSWTISGNEAVGSYSYGNTSYLVTPPLLVSGTTDELTFQYKANGTSPDIYIYTSKDGGSYTQYGSAISLATSDTEFQTYTITGLEAGTYTIRFKADNYTLDNFEGFKLNLPDHILSISSYTIPASTSYNTTMKEGNSFEASVTVKEGRGVEEALTAKLYMGSEPIGTATGTVSAKGETTLTIACTPTTSATSGIMMHIEVEYAGGTLTTPNVSRYVAAITRLMLDQTSSDAITAGTYDFVTLKRPFLKGWNTVCLPFTISNVETFFGTGAKAYTFNSIGENGLNFTSITELTASYPYLLYLPTAITEDIVLTDVTINSGDATAWYTRQTDSSNNAYYFRGTYTPIAAGEWTKNADTDIIYVVSNADAKIMKAGANATMKGFRGYFDVAATAGARMAIFFDDDTTTGIGTIENGELTIGTDVYNLQGQKVQSLKKGLYIVNGKKVVRK